MTRVQNALLAMTLMVLGSAMFLATSGLMSTQAQRGNRSTNSGDYENRPSNPRRSNTPDIPEEVPLWEDFTAEEITQRDRLKARPGNFACLEVISNFFVGLTDVQPSLIGVAYPCGFAGYEVGNESEAEIRLRDLGRSSQKDGIFRNSVRLRNLFITSMDFLELKNGLKDTAATDAFKISGNDAHSLRNTLGAQHKEQALLVRVHMRIEMLDSDQIENNDVGGALVALVRKANGWHVVYFSN